MYSWQHILIWGLPYKASINIVDQQKSQKDKTEKEEEEGKRGIYINTRLLNDQVDCLAGSNFFSNGLVYEGDEECERLLSCLIMEPACHLAYTHTPYASIPFCLLLFVFLLSFSSFWFGYINI